VAGLPTSYPGAQTYHKKLLIYAYERALAMTHKYYSLQFLNDRNLHMNALPLSIDEGCAGIRTFQVYRSYVNNV
jgi:hypothetical protein